MSFPSKQRYLSNRESLHHTLLIPDLAQTAAGLLFRCKEILIDDFY